MANIFEKVRLRPSQLRTVSERRFADAKYLCDSGQNERANGAMYLGGFVIECLLKSLLLEKYAWLQAARSPRELTEQQRFIWLLCYRSHDLDEILDCVPEIYVRLDRYPPGERPRLMQDLKLVCAQWMIFARYSPRSTDIPDAEEFLRRIKEIKKWVK